MKTRITARTVAAWKLEVLEGNGTPPATLGKVTGTRAHAMEVAYDRYEKLAIDQGDIPKPRSQCRITVIALCTTCERQPRMAGWDICAKCDGIEDRERGETKEDRQAAVDDYLATLDALDDQADDESEES